MNERIFDFNLEFRSIINNFKPKILFLNNLIIEESQKLKFYLFINDLKQKLTVNNLIFNSLNPLDLSNISKDKFEYKEVKN